MIDTAGNIREDLYSLKNEDTVSKILVTKEIQKLKDQGITTADAEAIYHHAEDPKLPLTPKQQQAFDSFKPIADEAQALASKLKQITPLASNEGYVHRVAVNKGGLFDKLLSDESGHGLKKASSLIKKSAPGLKTRRFRIIKDANGNRTVVHIKGGRVTAFNQKVPSDMGQLDIQKEEALMEKELAPIKAKLAVVQKELSILEATKGRAAASPARIKTLQGEMAKLVNQMSDIEAKYNPDELNNKKTIIRGKQYTIGEATTKEIEQHTNTQYYKNYFANTLTNYMDLVRAYRATKAMEKLLESPESEQFAMKAGTQTAPKGWTNTDAIRGYYFEPHVAKAIRIVLEGNVPQTDLGRAIGKINLVLRDLIVLNPFFHGQNLIANAIVNRGATKLLNPLRYPKDVQNLVKSFSSVKNQDADYLQMIRDGVPLALFGQGSDEYYKGLLSLFEDEKSFAQKDPSEQAKQLWDAVKSVPKTLKNSTSFLGDVLVMARMHELETEGLSRKAAIKELTKDMPDYKLPMGMAGDLLRNHNVLLFGSYEYSLFKSLTNIVKDLAAPATGAYSGGAEGAKAGAKTAFQALNKIAALIFIIYVARERDKLLQKLTHNPNAHASIPGSAGLVMAINNMVNPKAENPQNFSDFASARLAVFSKEAAQQVFNRDAFTGNTISPYGPSQLQMYKDRVAHIIQNLPQVGQISGATSPAKYIEGLFGIYTPKNSPAENSFEGFKAQKQTQQSKLKKLIQQSSDPYNDPKVQDLVDQYNSTLLDKADKAGYSAVPPGYLMRYPEASTIKKYLGQ